MTEEKMNRISALSKLSKERALTPAELAEQKELRTEYIQGFRNSLEGQLDRIYFVDDEGKQEKLEKKKNNSL